jgi:hypothetical protein
MMLGKYRVALRLAVALVLICCLIFTSTASAFFGAGREASETPAANDLDSSASEMRSAIERYVADRGSLFRSYPVEISQARQTRFKQFYSEWLGSLAKLNFDAMSLDGKVDYVLFRLHLDHELQQLEIQNKAFAEVAPFLPFAQTITDLAEARRRMEKIEPAKIATQLNELNKQIDAARRATETSLRGEPGKLKRSVANRAATTLGSLRGYLRTWFGYYNGYDPLFTWWADEPYKAVDQSLSAYATFLSERGAGLRSGGGAAGPTMAGAPGGAGGGGGGRGGGAGAGGGFGGGG